MGQIIRSPVISVCLVCLSALSRSQFLTDFDEIWDTHLEPDTKEPFRWGPISNRGIPYFYGFTQFSPKLPPIHNAFSMGVLKQDMLLLGRID